MKLSFSVRGVQAYFTSDNSIKTISSKYTPHCPTQTMNYHSETKKYRGVSYGA